MAFEGLVELTLRDICKDFILSFIGCAIGDSGREAAGETAERNHTKQTLITLLTLVDL